MALKVPHLLLILLVAMVGSHALLSNYLLVLGRIVVVGVVGEELSEEHAHVGLLAGTVASLGGVEAGHYVVLQVARIVMVGSSPQV